MVRVLPLSYNGGISINERFITVAKSTKNTERKAIDKVFILLGSGAVVVLAVAGAVLWYGYNFATGMVKDQLAAQKIYFPAADSAAIKALDDADRKAVEKYAGQQLVDGDQARVYADHYIGAHLKHTAGGKTYSEVSTEAQKDPTNAKLQAQKTTLFQGETLRGMLLGSGYAFWTFGMIAKFSAMAAFGGALIMAVFVLLGVRHLRSLR